MKIGIVLPDLPTYSETFFRSKIRGLAENKATIFLFINNKVTKTDLPTTVKTQLQVTTSNFLNALLVIFTSIKALLFYPSILLKFVRAERQDGKTWRQVAESIYINHHLLSVKQLDWLHFGFATMAIGRENVAKTLGAKMAVSFRGYDVSIYPLKHPGCYKQLWQKADKIHTISDDLLMIARNQLQLPIAIPVQKITPAINVANFHTTASYLNKARSNPVQLLTVARLHWKKGLEYTLEALSILEQQGVDFHYTIIGDGLEYERLMFTAHQLGINEKVHFAGKIPHEQINNYYEQADIYLQYSVQEGFCNAVLEAQAMGLLCVVSDAEGLPENVIHTQTGWVVPRRKPVLLAQQLEAILEMETSVLDAIRLRATQRVQATYNLEIQQQAFLEFYQLEISKSLSLEVS